MGYYNVPQTVLLYMLKACDTAQDIFYFYYRNKRWKPGNFKGMLIHPGECVLEFRKASPLTSAAAINHALDKIVVDGIMEKRNFVYDGCKIACIIRIADHHKTEGGNIQ